MKRLVIINVFLGFLFLAWPNKLLADDKFCIRENGFLKPLLSKEKCLSKEIEVNKSEFREIKDLDPKLRPKALLEFRKKEIARKEIESQEQEKIKQKQINLALLEKKFKKKCEKNLFGGYEVGSKEYNQCLIFADEVEKVELKKRDEQLAEGKKRKEQWDLNLKQREQERKELAIQKQSSKNDFLKKREEFNKKVAELKERNKNLPASNKVVSVNNVNLKKNESEKSSLTKIDNIVKDNTFKVFYYNKNIVNKDKLLSAVSSNSEINILEKLNKNDIDLLIAKNSDFVLVLPLDYIVFSNVVTVNKMTSQLVAGVQQVPNPEFSRLQRELQNAEREYIMAKQQEAYFFRQGQNSGNYGWAALITQAANVAAQIEAGEKAQGFRDQHNSLTASLSTTPMYIDKELFQSYSYDVKNIQSEKKGIFKLIEIRENQFIEKNLELTEKKLFKIANNIEVSDKNYENLKNKFNSLEDITTWENRPLKKVDYKSLVERYNQIDAAKVKTLLDHKELYASLDLSIPKAKKEKSFFSKLFDFGSDERKESNQESKGEDRRFQSVVIVKTSKGLGSGFYVEKNKVITNYHVIENSTSVNIENFNGEKGSAKIIKADKMRDLALLEVNLKGKPVELSSEVLYSGMQVAALGHPSGLSFSMTQGIISSIRKYSTTYDVTGNSNILFVQTDAAINKGNSGGPLFHKNSVIGVNTQGLNKSKTEGLNFAVHVEELKKFLDD